MSFVNLKTKNDLHKQTLNKKKNKKKKERGRAPSLVLSLQATIHAAVARPSQTPILYFAASLLVK